MRDSLLKSILHVAWPFGQGVVAPELLLDEELEDDELLLDEDELVELDEELLEEELLDEELLLEELEDEELELAPLLEGLPPQDTIKLSQRPTTIRLFIFITMLYFLFLLNIDRLYYVLVDL